MTNPFLKSVCHVQCIDITHTSLSTLEAYFVNNAISWVIAMQLRDLHNMHYKPNASNSETYFCYFESDTLYGTLHQSNGIFISTIDMLTCFVFDTSPKILQLFKVLEIQLFQQAQLFLTPEMVNYYDAHFGQLRAKTFYGLGMFDAHIEVSDALAIPYNTLCERYSLKLKAQKDADTFDYASLRLKNIFFKDLNPICFQFTDGSTTIDFVNLDFLNALYQLISYSEVLLRKEEYLNRLLERIFKSGLSSLTAEEIEFLDGY